MTREQLGLDQKDPRAFRLPDGLDVVGDSWFVGSGIERLIIPNTVRTLENSAFIHCEKLREVVFESGSQLESIGNLCFGNCDIE